MTSLYVESGGTGPPLVLWHGWGSNLRIFDALRARLAPRFTMYAADLPGHGRSNSGAVLDDAATLDSLMATVPQGAVLLGWSLGGQWALRAALARPQRLRALVLVHTTPRFVAAADWPHGLSVEVMQQFGTQLLADREQCLRNFLELQLRGSRGVAPSPDELHRTLLAHGAASLAQLQRDLQRLSDTDLRAQLGALRVPTLAIGGQHDRITPPAAADFLGAVMAGGRTARIARAGHLSFLSHPQAFDAAFDDFLGSLPAVAA